MSTFRSVLQNYFLELKLNIQEFKQYYNMGGSFVAAYPVVGKLFLKK
jgi:hypothetical protein